MTLKSNLAALHDLAAGRSAVIAMVDEGHAELMEAGFVPGVFVTPTHSGVGGDPRVYEVDGNLVALRSAGARHVYVTLPDPRETERD